MDQIVQQITDIEQKKAFVDLSKGLTSCLRFLSGHGCRGVDCSEKTYNIIKSWDIDAIRFSVAACNRCALADSGKKVVCGSGNPNSKLVFVGGIPEPEDGDTGIPYSGRAGELLAKIISAMKLDRESVYITHALKCCAKDKQESVRENLKICKSFLFEEIEIIKPKVICTLGDLAAAAVLGGSVPVRRIRGRFHVYKKIQVMPTYSPEHLIDHPEDKRAAWEDIQQVMRLFESG